MFQNAVVVKINFIILAFLPFELRSQSENIEFENLLSISSLSEQNESFDEDLNSILMDQWADPIDLNKVSKERLQSTGFLTPEQIQHFLVYRTENGPFVSVWEIQQVEGWDRNSCKLFSEMAFVNPGYSRLFDDFGSNSELLLREIRQIQKKRGFYDSALRFEGDRNKLQARFQSVSSGDYKVAIAMEKDAGEKFYFGSNQPGFDHFSGNISIFNRRFIKAIVLGDYRLQFGQGLVYGSSFGGRKSSQSILNLRKPNTGLIPSASFSETGFLRGAAASLGIKNFEITTYCSRRLRDARVLNDSLQSERYFASFNETGLHRTVVEKNNENQVTELVAGGTFSYKWSAGNISVQVMGGKFSLPLSKSREPYRLYRFTGERFHSESIYLNYANRNFYLFHESATSNGNSLATLSGIILALSAKVDASFLFRYYSQSFFTLYGNAFGETSTLNNEIGFYWGIKYQFLPSFSISAYFDYFKFPWLRFGVSNPSDGYEHSLRIDYLSKVIPIYLVIKREEKYQGVGINGEHFDDLYFVKTSVTGNIHFKMNRRLSGSIRPSTSYAKSNGQIERGVVLRQDFRIEMKPWIFSTGYSLFDVSDFEARIYAGEPEMRLLTTFPVFIGKGIRYFFLLKLKANSSLSIWLKYYLTSYNNIDEIGSGVDSIKGNKISEIKGQVIYSFR